MLFRGPLVFIVAVCPHSSIRRVYEQSTSADEHTRMMEEKTSIRSRRTKCSDDGEHRREDLPRHPPVPLMLADKVKYRDLVSLIVAHKIWKWEEREKRRTSYSKRQDYMCLLELGFLGLGLGVVYSHPISPHSTRQTIEQA